MKVLFFNDLWDPRIGSSVRQMYQQAERLRELGHQTAIVSTTPDRSGVGWTAAEGTDLFLIWSDYPARFRPWVGLRNRRVLGPLREVLAAWKPDVVHTHLIHTHLSYASLELAREAGAGVVFTAHDSMTYCYQKLDCFHGGEGHGWKRRDYRAHWSKCIPCQRLRFRPGRNAAIREALARDVHRFTVVTDELGVAVRANGIRVDRTINNAIRLRTSLPDEAAVSAFRRRFELEQKPVVAIGGRLHGLKGVNQVFRMLAVLRAEFPELRMLVLGDEKIYREGFEPEARRAGVADLVVSTGWLDGEELAASLATIDVMLTPSICFETFGMMNLEAMEYKKPIVATCFGGCPEVVQDGVNGLVANPYEIEAFAECIARLLRDPELRRAMGEAGHRRLVEHFTIDRLTDEFLEEYRLASDAARGPF